MNGDVASRPHVLRGVVFALIGSICWGFSGTCAQLLMNTYGAPSEWITCVRMLVCALFFLGGALIADWRALFALFRDRRSLVSIAAFAVFGIILCQLSYLEVIHYTSAGVGTTIEQFGLVLIMFWTCIKGRRLPKVREVGGLVFALGGLILIATQGDLSRLAVPAEGLVWGLLAALGLALYTVMPVRVLSKWGSMLVTGMAMLFGGLVMTPFTQPWNVPIELSFGAIASFAAIVLVGTCAAYMLFLQGVKDAGSMKAGLLCAVEPVSAMLLAVVWLHTPVSGWDIAGCISILVMIVLVTEFKKPEDAASPADPLRAFEAEALAEEAPVFAGRASVLGLYQSRPATMEDFKRVQGLLDQAHENYADMGIEEGRYKKYPSARRLTHSIKNGTTHVVENVDGKLIAVYAVSFDPDKNYAKGINGAWLTPTDNNPQAYAELHWVAVDAPFRRRGVGSFILDRACRLAREGGRASLRADIYPDNEPMRWLLEKRRFTFCGTLQVRNTFGLEKRRSAYEMLVR